MSSPNYKKIVRAQRATSLLFACLSLFLLVVGLLSHDMIRKIITLIGAGTFLILTVSTVIIFERSKKQQKLRDSVENSVQLNPVTDEYMIRRNVTSFIPAFGFTMLVLWSAALICPPVDALTMINLAFWGGLAIYTVTALLRGAVKLTAKKETPQFKVFAILSLFGTIFSAAMSVITVVMLITQHKNDWSSLFIFLSCGFICAAWFYRLYADATSTAPHQPSVLARKAHKDMSIDEVSQVTGLSWRTIRAIENSTYSPSLNVCQLICRTLDTPFENLFPLRSQVKEDN